MAHLPSARVALKENGLEEARDGHDIENSPSARGILSRDLSTSRRRLGFICHAVMPLPAARLENSSGASGPLRWRSATPPIDVSTLMGQSF